MARYAIAKLYKHDISSEVPEENGDSAVDGSKASVSEDKLRGKIAGLEPVNFITSATPHLGSRGHRQVQTFYFLVLNDVTKIYTVICYPFNFCKMLY